MRLCECGCGQPTRLTKHRFVHGHNRQGSVSTRVPVVAGYRTVRTVNGTRTLQRVRAERALGKPLPLGAVIHHADGTQRDDAPLVICQDQAYHKLIHARMRVIKCGGNPNTDAVCGTCGVAKPRGEFRRHHARVFGVGDACRTCINATERARRNNVGGIAARG